MSRDDDSEANWGSAAAWTRGWQEPEQQRTPLLSERYCIDAELGRGGMGVVHVATDRWLGRQVALKRPRVDIAIQRMMREAAITARLTHPSIAPILDVGEDELGPFYTMPILIGQAPCPSVPLFRWVQMVRDASLAVAHAHAQGIVHRDLKPDNLLWGDQHQLWVLDWGIAYDPAGPDSGVVGTPGFAAPEQLEGTCCPASDVYSLGCILQLHDELDTALLAVVERATHQDPAERYSDGLALANELERWMAGGRVRAHSYSAGEIARVWLAQNRGIAVVTVVGLASVIALTIGVFVVQAQAQTRTNRALAESLVQRAQSLSLAGARAEAEVYASHALTLAELPAARGVMMRWAATPRPVQLGTVPPLCPGSWTLYGERVCVTDTRATWFGLDGIERGSAPIDRDIAGAHSRYDIAFWDGGMLSAAPPIQWVDGVPHELEAESGAAKLALGPVPAYSYVDSVYRADLATRRGEVWVDNACLDGVQEVVTDREPAVIICRQPEMILAFEAGEQRIEVPGHPVLARWLGDVLAVATYEGDVALWDGKDWELIPTGAGPVATAFALDDERLLVTTERLVTRVLDRTVGSWVVDFPRGFDASVPTPSGIRGLRAAGGIDYEWSWQGVAGGLDAAALGGVAGMALHEDGQLLAIGHAEGTVDLWELQTGELSRHTLPGNNVAKALVWDGDTLVVNNGQSHRLEDGAWQHESTDGYFRRLYTMADFLVAWTPPERLVFRRLGGGGVFEMRLPAHPSDVVSDGERLWTLDALGLLQAVTAEGVQDQLTVPRGGRALVVMGDTFIMATEDEVIALTKSGERLWAVPVTTPVTDLAVNERFVAVGTQVGRVDIRDAATGRLLAEHQPHTRRISALILTDDELFTGSWDGLVTRMGLRPLTASPRELNAETLSDWAFGVDDLRN